MGGDHGDTAGVAVRPNALQQGALDALHNHLGGGGRAVVVMPCGSGKTLVGRWFAEQVGARLVVVVVPSLALVRQTVLAYRAGVSWPHQCMIVCSDESAGRLATNDMLQVPDRAGERIPVSTSPTMIKQWLTGTAGARLVVTTYQSAPRVAEALRRSRMSADLVMCDEAHRLTGRPSRRYRSVLDERTLPAGRRLFLTATPVHVAAWDTDLGEMAAAAAPLSLDDQTTFGKTVYEATFREGIDAGCLVDYDVKVVTDRGDAGGPSGGRRRVRSAEVQAVLAAVKAGSRRILTFHTRVAKARRLATLLDGRMVHGRRLRVEYLHQRHSAKRRAEALHRLANPAEGEIAVLASARVLREGVDVPAVDTVVIVGARTSMLEVVQILGRAMRTAPGKARGLVILAVTLGGDLDEETQLASSRWRYTWLALRAIATMDSRFAASLREVAGRRRRPSALEIPRPRLELAVPADLNTDSWLLSVVDPSGAQWLLSLHALQSWARVHGHARPPHNTVHAGVAVGRWVLAQQRCYALQSLTAAQIAHLQAQPGWAWNRWEQSWQLAAQQWRVEHDTGGRSCDPASPQQWACLHRPGYPNGRYRRLPQYRTLAEFAVDTCGLRLRRELPVHLKRAAEQLTHWSWHIVPERDLAMLHALVEYGAWKRSFNPPHDYLHDDDLRLGAWVTHLRWCAYTDRLHPILSAALNLIHRRHPTITPLHWRPTDTRWGLGYQAMRQYAEREGTCRPPPGHREYLATQHYTVRLDTWHRTQQHQHAAGTINPDRAAMLERLQGWAWHSGPRGLVDPQPVAQHVRWLIGQHIPRAVIARAAQVSLATVRTLERGHPTRIYAAIAERLLAVTAQAAINYQPASRDRTPATPARDHIRGLLDHGVTQRAIAAAAGVNPALVRLVKDGQHTTLRADQAAALRAVTLDAIHAHPGGHRRPADTSVQLLHRMLGLGWPQAWIAREIHLLTGSKSFRLTRQHVTQEHAQAITTLNERLGNRRPPPRRGHASLPTLAELLANEHTLPTPTTTAHHNTGTPRIDPHIPELVTLPQAATILGISVRTAARRFDQGLLPGQRVGNAILLPAAPTRALAATTYHTHTNENQHNALPAGGQPPTTTTIPTLLTAREVATIFGVTYPHKAVTLYNSGHLPGRPVTVGTITRIVFAEATVNTIAREMHYPATANTNPTIHPTSTPTPHHDTATIPRGPHSAINGMAVSHPETTQRGAPP